MTHVENQREFVLHAHGLSPEGVATDLIRSLLGLLGPAGGQRESASVAPLQASGRTLEEMLEELARDFLETVESSPSRVVDAELSHVMKTGDVLRAWGYIWFGKEASVNRSFSVKGDLDLFTTEMEGFEVRVTLLVSGAPLDAGTEATADRER